MSAPGDFRFPLALPSRPLSRRLAVLMGEVTGALKPGRRHELLAGGIAHDGLLRSDFWMLAAAASRARDDRRWQPLAALHRRFWESASAASFQVSEADTRYQRFLAHHESLLLPPLRAAIAAQGCTRLIEIGPGTGEVLAHLAAGLPGLRRLVGLECNAGLVAHAQARHHDPRLHFECGDGLTLARCHGGPKCVFLSYGGVLEYLGSETVAEWFGWIAANARPAVLALVEPLAADHALESERRSQAYGVERSLSHNYPALAKIAGLRVRHRQECVVNQQRWLILIAETAENPSA